MTRSQDTPGTPRPRRLALALPAAAIVLVAVISAYLEHAGRTPAASLLAGGSTAAVEVRGLERQWRRLGETRFLERFGRSRSAAAIEESRALREFDALIAEWGRISHLPLKREHLLDLVGADAAAALYRPAGEEGDVPFDWAVSCRLSRRAWLLARAFLLWDGLRGGEALLRREEGRWALNTGDARWPRVHAVLKGRLLAAASAPGLLAGPGGAPLFGAPPAADSPEPGDGRLRFTAGAGFPVLLEGAVPLPARWRAISAVRLDALLGPRSVLHAAVEGITPPAELSPPVRSGGEPFSFNPPDTMAFLLVRGLPLRREWTSGLLGERTAGVLAGLGEEWGAAVQPAPAGLFPPLPQAVLFADAGDQAGARRLLDEIFPAGAPTPLAGGVMRETGESAAPGGRAAAGAALGRYLLLARRREPLAAAARWRATGGGDLRAAPGFEGEIPRAGAAAVVYADMKGLVPFLSGLALLAAEEPPREVPPALDLRSDADLLAALDLVSGALRSVPGGWESELTLAFHDLPPR